jgi:hypothetical protein
MDWSIGNIGLRGQRLRRLIGWITLAAAVVAAVGLILGGAGVWWRLLLLVPFTLGILALLEARGKT